MPTYTGISILPVTLSDSGFFRVCLNCKVSLPQNWHTDDYQSEVFPFQRIKCFLKARNIKEACFELSFKFYNAEAAVCYSPATGQYTE